MESSDEENKKRRERITSLVEKLKAKKKSRSMTENITMNKPVTRRGKHTHYKLYLGWQHFDREKYRVVTVKRGGGTRMIEYKSDEPICVKSIIEEGKKRFFPNNESQQGKLSEMEIGLANFAGNEITDFEDLEGNPCSFQSYLKAHGLYSSQSHLYMRTKKKGIESPPSFYVNGIQAGTVKIKYQKTVASVYDNRCDSAISCYSTLSCYNMVHDHEQEFEHFHPQEHGFFVTEFENDNVKYHPQSQNDTTERQNNVLFYGPDVIFGIEEDIPNFLFLGVLADPPVHDVKYIWEKNNDIIYADCNKQSIKVKEEGVYTLTIEAGALKLFIGQPVVVTFSGSTVHSEVVTSATVSSQDSATGFTIGESSLAVTALDTAKVMDISPPDNNVYINTMDLNTNIHVSANEYVIQSTPSLSMPCDSDEHNIPLKKHIGQILPHDSIIISSHVTSDSQEDSTDINTSITEISSPKSITTLATDSLSQDSKDITAPVTGIEVQESKDITAPLTYFSPKDSKDITAPITKISLGDSTDVTAPITSASSKDNLRCSNLIADVSLEAVVVNTSAGTNSSQKELGTVTATTTDAPLKASAYKHTLLGGPSASNILLSEELTTALVKIPSKDLHIEQEINRGAFGVVFKAQWNGTDVAVKQLAVKRMKKMKKMLARELEISATIRHPNIILLMGYNVDGNQLNLIPEYINGPNLDQVLFDEGKFDFPIEKKVMASYQVCAAVTYLHNRYPLILHRDIKPDNIVLTKCLTTAKLCDMGLSKFKSMTTVITTMASGSTQPGTPSYQAPEVLVHNMPASSKTDIWSLCATLVELFSEETVWEMQTIDENENETSFEQTIRNSMRSRKQPDGLTALLALTLPAKMKELIASGLNYEPNARPQALELCEVFREMSSGMNI